MARASGDCHLPSLGASLLSSDNPTSQLVAEPIATFVEDGGGLLTAMAAAVDDDNGEAVGMDLLTEFILDSCKATWSRRGGAGVDLLIAMAAAADDDNGEAAGMDLLTEFILDSCKAGRNASIPSVTSTRSSCKGVLTMRINLFSVCNEYMEKSAGLNRRPTKPSGCGEQTRGFRGLRSLIMLD
jgi:hypothetical protein